MNLMDQFYGIEDISNLLLATCSDRRDRYGQLVGICAVLQN
jgi:hypothetical protein